MHVKLITRIQNWTKINITTTQSSQATEAIRWNYLLSNLFILSCPAVTNSLNCSS
jgi:hypothetical protein